MPKHKPVRINMGKPMLYGSEAALEKEGGEVDYNEVMRKRTDGWREAGLVNSASRKNPSVVEATSLNPLDNQIVNKGVSNSGGLLPLLAIANKLTGNWLGKICGFIGLGINSKSYDSLGEVKINKPSLEDNNLEEKWSRSKIEAAEVTPRIKHSGGCEMPKKPKPEAINIRGRSL